MITVHRCVWPDVYGRDLMSCPLAVSLWKKRTPSVSFTSWHAAVWFDSWAWAVSVPGCCWAELLTSADMSAAPPTARTQRERAQQVSGSKPNNGSFTNTGVRQQNRPVVCPFPNAVWEGEHYFLHVVCCGRAPDIYQVFLAVCSILFVFPVTPEKVIKVCLSAAYSSLTDVTTSKPFPLRP